MTKGYLISEGLKDKIHATIERVAGTPYGGGVTNVTPRLEFPPSSPGDTPRLAAYPRTAVWAKGKTMAVTFYTHSGTAFGLSSSGTAGTATALNISGEFLVLPDGDANEAIGPTPTMTWCIIGKSRGGANVALEAQQPPIRLAAYDVTEGPWEKGTQREIAFYDVAGGSIVFSGVTATAGNVSQTFYPMATASSGTAVGPTPTMAWVVVSESPSGPLLAVEAENDPLVRLATVSSAGTWQRGSMRTVKITGTTRTEDVYSNFDYYSELDLPHGLVYAKTPYSPAGAGQTANVVIGPPPVPLHAAKYENGGDWQRDQEKLITVLPSDGVTQVRQITAVNKHFDTIEASDKTLAIGKIGTAYHVIAGPEGSSVKVGSRAEFGDKDYFWQRGSTWYIDPAGAEQSVPVKSVFDTYSHLDLHDGVAFVKAKDPDDVESTVNIVISPAPIPMYEATTEETGTWDQNDEKVLTVAPAGGRQQSLDVNVTNKFFEDIELEGRPIAIGKFNDQFFALTGGSSSGVKLADRTGSGQWEKSSQQGIRFQGTTTEVQAYNFVGHYESFDGRGTGGTPGVAVVKGKELGAAPGTAWYVISPPPITFRTGTFTGRWTRGQTKSITLTSSPTGTITVVNNFGAVGTTASGSRNCAMSKEGNQWYLIAAECS